MHFCNAEPLVMLPVIVQASIPFCATCVRKAIKNGNIVLRDRRAGGYGFCKPAGVISSQGSEAPEG